MEKLTPGQSGKTTNENKTPTGAETAAPKSGNPIRRLYDWVISWAEHPNASTALFLLAFAESSFFPIPPDVLLITLAIAMPRKSFKWAAIALAGSVTGGIVGYLLGLNFMAIIGDRILDFYHLQSKYGEVQELYRRYDAWAVAVGGFTPLPYKLFTITAGAFRINFLTFVIASIISRAGRFFLVAGFIYLFGPKVRYFLEKYFNLFTIIFTILLIGGFIIIKWLL